MSDFILHHYYLSPYSEKIRAMLAYTGIDWLSVIHKEMPPRPKLKPLAGNYGRIPVAQIGSDIFCDTYIIAAEIARIANKPELDLKNANQEVQEFVSKVEGKIFFAAIMRGGSFKLTKKVLSTMSWSDIARFFVDRLKMGATATTDNLIKFSDAKKILHEHLVDMEDRLEGDFIFGDKVGIADFAAYHSLWFVRDVGECEFINHYPTVCAWMDRIKALGSVKVTHINAQNAIDIAKDSQPRVIKRLEAMQSENIEKEVSIAPCDYRQIKTQGILKFADATRWVIARDNEQVGRVHVHFPKQGYSLS